MTQEEKQLLLADLCARLPYRRVKVHCESYCGAQIVEYDLTLTIKDSLEDFMGEDENCKPYLRSMSSMTEAEMEEYNDTWELDRKDILTVGEELKNDYKHKGYKSIWGHPVVPLYRYIDWLNKNMFDYRGLIEKGLALEAPSYMYNIEE